MNGFNDFVADNSVTVGWFIEDQATPQKDAVLTALLSGEYEHMLVPALWQYEIVNVLLVATRRKKLDAATLPKLLHDIDQLPVIIDPYPQQRAAIMRLGLRYNLTAYDASYLELAMRYRLPLATTDNALIAAAKHANVPLL